MFGRLEFDPELDSVNGVQMMAAMTQRLCNSNETEKMKIIISKNENEAAMTLTWI